MGDEGRGTGDEGGRCGLADPGGLKAEVGRSLPRGRRALPLAAPSGALVRLGALCRVHGFDLPRERATGVARRRRRRPFPRQPHSATRERHRGQKEQRAALGRGHGSDGDWWGGTGRVGPWSGTVGPGFQRTESGWRSAEDSYQTSFRSITVALHIFPAPVQPAQIRASQAAPSSPAISHPARSVPPVQSHILSPACSVPSPTSPASAPHPPPPATTPPKPCRACRWACGGPGSRSR